MFEQLTAFLDHFLDMGVPGYDCLLYKDGQEIFHHQGGYQDLERKLPMTGTERYHIYSCSKPITCTAALQLYEQGLFRLEDHLSDYLPEFKTMYVQGPDGLQPAKYPITIRDLFCMTAGFSYDFHSPSLELARQETGGRCPTRETIRYLAREPLLFEPGQQWKYSLCHDVLAALVEVLSGQRFGAYVKAHIFDPLGMHNSTFSLPLEELDTIAPQYTFDPRTRRPVCCGKGQQLGKLGSEYESGGAGCVSTARDYIQFLEALRVGDMILKTETIDLMATNHLTPAQLKTFSDPVYGYGLGVRCSRGGDGLTDFGWGGAAGAFPFVDRAHGITLYYAQHLLAPPNRAQRKQVLRYALADLGL